MRRHSLTLLGTAAALLISSAPTRAATVDFIGYAHGSESVGFTLAYGGPASLDRSGSTGAGGFSTILNGNLPSFTTYCVDLYQFISFADPAYDGYVIKPGALHSFANTQANADLGRLYASAGSSVVDAHTEAAFQIAVWEIAFETSHLYDVGDGTARFTGTASTLALADSWVHNLGVNGVPITVLESERYQDVVYAPIPEPETYALMLAGLGIIGWLTRRNHRNRG